MKKVYSAILIFFLVTILLFFERTGYLSFEYLTHSIAMLRDVYHESPYLFVVSYFMFYVFIASLPMPGAMTLALLCGVIMGFIPALILVSFASAVGACCSMLIARYLLRDIIVHKFQSLYCKVQKGFQEDGFLYIIFLRFLPIPFFIVNIMLGLTPVSVYMFYIASQIGLFPTLFLIVKAGAELGLIENPQEIFSPTIIALFILMALFPFFVKKIFVLFCKKNAELEL